jgi:IS5 family transposase
MQKSFLAIAQMKKQLKCERFLNEMNTVIPWSKFIDEIKPFYTEKELGRKRTDLKMLLKIYFLQQWYNLSDPGAEEAIYDRNSFQKFLEIDLLSSNVPDETTILNFRHLLEKHQLPTKLFEKVNELLFSKGLIMKEGTSVDATIIAAPSSTKNQKKERDSEMKSTKKGSNYHFGMKAHIGVESKNGFVHSLKTTSANVHDKAVMEDLLHGEEKIVLGDKGYYKEEDKNLMREKGIYCGIMDKAKRGKKLSNKQKKRNRKLASIRGTVEFPFKVLKDQWNYKKVRYKGLFKNTMQLYTLFSLINLYRARKILVT